MAPVSFTTPRIGPWHGAYGVIPPNSGAHDPAGMGAFTRPRIGPWHGAYGVGGHGSKPAGGITNGPAKRQQGTGGQQGPPLDAQYYLNVAGNQFRVNNQLTGLEQARGYAKTDLQSALSQLSHQQPIDQLHQEQAANRQGALFSTVLGQNLGNLNRSYLDRGAQDTQTFNRTDAARLSQEEGLRGSEPLYEASQALASANRASLAAQHNPALGESTKPLGPKGRLAHAIAHGGHGSASTGKPVTYRKGKPDRAGMQAFTRPRIGPWHGAYGVGGK